jgi:hypothetical protein
MRQRAGARWNWHKVEAGETASGGFPKRFFVSQYYGGMVAQEVLSAKIRTPGASATRISTTWKK